MHPTRPNQQIRPRTILRIQIPFNSPLINVLHLQLSCFHSTNNFLERMRDFLARSIGTTHVENSFAIMLGHVLHLEEVGEDFGFEEGCFAENVDGRFVVV